MLMVIFGAGASYDSCPTYLPGADVPTSDANDRLNKHNRPPLADELFENRPLFAEAIESYPQCQPIVPRLRSLTGETLEAALQDLQAKAESFPRGAQQLFAVRYYLQHVIRGTELGWSKVTRGVTNYKTLLNEIERTNKGNQPVCLVTFNYDTLLEDALRDFGLAIDTLSDYTKKHTFYRVFKLHGSVNWAREIETKLNIQNPQRAWSIVSEVIDHATEIKISGNYVLTGGERPIGLVNVGRSNEKPGFPAIAIPVEKKPGFECPQHMLDELVALLPQISTVLVIGWRATEAHFLDLLKQHLKKGVYLPIVMGNQARAESVRVHIHETLLNNPPSCSPESTGFSEFLLSRRAEQILADRLK